VPKGESGEVEVWGDGEQTRSFPYIDECLEGTVRLMRSDCSDVLNIGSDEMMSINGLVPMISDVEKMNVRLKHVSGPLGVRCRNSDNSLIVKKLAWRPSQPLIRGSEGTYSWIAQQVRMSRQRSDSFGDEMVTHSQIAHWAECGSVTAAAGK
jgi:nucleoside-diphosphate-sugar epimerase